MRFLSRFRELLYAGMVITFIIKTRQSKFRWMKKRKIHIPLFENTDNNVQNFL